MDAADDGRSKRMRRDVPAAIQFDDPDSDVIGLDDAWYVPPSPPRVILSNKPLINLFYLRRYLFRIGDLPCALQHTSCQNLLHLPLRTGSGVHFTRARAHAHTCPFFIANSQQFHPFFFMTYRLHTLCEDLGGVQSKEVLQRRKGRTWCTDTSEQSPCPLKVGTRECARS